MSLNTINVSPIEMTINADRNQVFQLITNFGTIKSGSGSSRILSREGNILLVEFNIKVRVFFGVQKMFRTLEKVTFHEPELVEFEEIEGPLVMRKERMELTESGSNTRIRYEAKFTAKGWVFGWLLGLFFIRPKLKHTVKSHLLEMKKTLETGNN